MIASLPPQQKELIYSRTTLQHMLQIYHFPVWLLFTQSVTCLLQMLPPPIHYCFSDNSHIWLLYCPKQTHTIFWCHHPIAYCTLIVSYHKIFFSGCCIATNWIFVNFLIPWLHWMWQGNNCNAIIMLLLPPSPCKYQCAYCCLTF